MKFYHVYNLLLPSSYKNINIGYHQNFSVEYIVTIYIYNSANMVFLLYNLWFLKIISLHL